jgi:hypothetical protein
MLLVIIFGIAEKVFFAARSTDFSSVVTKK